MVGPKGRQGYKSALTWLVWLRRRWIFHESRRASQVSRSICLLSYFIPCNMHLFTCWLNISQRPPKRTNREDAPPLADIAHANKRRVESYREREERKKTIVCERESESIRACWPWEMQKVDRGSDVGCILPLTASIFQEHCSSSKQLFYNFKCDGLRELYDWNTKRNFCKHLF